MVYYIIAAAPAIPANIAAEAVTKWISILRPLKYDLYIFHIDGLLGFQPSFVVGGSLRRIFGYGALSLAMLAVFAAYLWRRPQAQAIALFKTFAFKPLRLAADLSTDPGERPAICISAVPNGHSPCRGAPDLSLRAAERDPVGALLDGPADRLVRETLAFRSPSENRCSNHGNRDARIRPALFSRSLAIPYAIAVYRVCNPSSTAVR